MCSDDMQRATNSLIEEESASIPIDEAMAQAEIDKGFTAPKTHPELIASAAVDAGDDEDAVAQAGTNIYLSSTASQKNRVRGLIDRLLAKAGVAETALAAINGSRATQQESTCSRGTPEQNGKMGAIDHFNRGKYWALGLLMIMLGVVMLKQITSLSFDASAAATAEIVEGGASAVKDTLRAGAFVVSISFGALMLEIWRSTLRSEKAKNIFLRCISIAACVCIALGAVMYSNMYGGNLDNGQGDPLGGSLRDLQEQTASGGSNSTFLPKVLIVLIIFAEALGAAALWTAGETVNDKFRPIFQKPTDEQDKLATRSSEKEKTTSRLVAMVIALKSIECAIDAAEKPFVDEFRTAFRVAAGTWKSTNKAEDARAVFERAQSELKRAQNNIDRHGDAGLFRARNTGDIG